MPWVLPETPLPTTSAHPDDDIFAELFTLDVTEGASHISWETASACSCLTPDSLQPRMSCLDCGGVGVIYAPAAQIVGLFRDQSRWLSFRRQGEFHHGEAELTTPLSVKPGYVDRRVRDRFTIAPTGETEIVFYTAAPPVPFVFNNIQRAWRVQLQSADLAQQLLQ